VNKGKWLCLILVLAALAIGVLVGWLLRGPNTMPVMLIDGIIYPAPEQKGQLLRFLDQHGHTLTALWDGPPGYESPCKEEPPPPSNPQATSTPFPTKICTIQPKFGNETAAYYYTFQGSKRPNDAQGAAARASEYIPVPATRPGGTDDSGDKDQHKARPAGSVTPSGTVYLGRPAFNAATNASGVWYASGTGNGFTDPIPANSNDQVEWNNAGASFTVTVLTGTCQENVTTFSTNDTCTVASNAVTQHYCVVYDGKNQGTADLMVNNQPVSTNTPTACTSPASRK
jgi:hypothetical protein